MPRSLPGPVIGLPPTETWPVVGSSKPATMRSRVDLPQPEAPITQTKAAALIVASMRVSASTSPSPTAKRLLTPRITTWGSSLSPMMLRAPLQHAIADDDDDAIGDKTAHADDNHAGYHQVGARERTAVHDHGSQSCGHARHLAD